MASNNNTGRRFSRPNFSTPVIPSLVPKKPNETLAEILERDRIQTAASAAAASAAAASVAAASARAAAEARAVLAASTSAAAAAAASTSAAAVAAAAARAALAARSIPSAAAAAVSVPVTSRERRLLKAPAAERAESASAALAAKVAIEQAAAAARAALAANTGTVSVATAVTAEQAAERLLAAQARADAFLASYQTAVWESYEEIEEEEGFWEVIERNDNEMNSLLEADNTTSTTPLEIIKDTVHQQIFVGGGEDSPNKGFLKELGSAFNSGIYFRRKNGRYALFIIPNDTNYMINVFNGFKNGTDRIFFNISLKQGSESRKKIKTEFMSEYVVKDGKIVHKYEMEGKPAILKKNKVNLSNHETIFNPYFELNRLSESYFGYGERIFMTTLLDIIKSKIGKLESKNLGPKDADDFKKIIAAFKDDVSKAAIDAKLLKDHAFLQRFTELQLKSKGPEDITYRIPNKELYRTNNHFTDILALRYAKYIHDFKFTKSCNGENTFTDPLGFKLTTPFTATDIYLHRFDRHFNNEYAMDRYQIQTPTAIRRLADLVELSKSLMFYFLSISYDLLNAPTPQLKKTLEFKYIYPQIVWTQHKEFTGNIFNTFDITINRRFNGIRITTIPKTTILYPPFNLFKLMDVEEIPFVGIFTPVDNSEKCKKTYEKSPVITSEERRKLTEIDLQGIEYFMLENIVITEKYLDELHSEFFKVEREQIKEKAAAQAAYVAPTGYDSKLAYPELGATLTSSSKLPAKTTEVAVPLAPVHTMPASASRGLSATSVVSAVSIAPAARTAADVLNTPIPYSNQIEGIIDEIKLIKKTVASESIQGGILHRLNSLIASLKEFKRMQENAYKDQGKPLPDSIRRLEEQLIAEGILEPKQSIRAEQTLQVEQTPPPKESRRERGERIKRLIAEGVLEPLESKKLSRTEQRFVDVSNEIEAARKILLEEQASINNYITKSETQGKIKVLMQRIHDAKYTRDVEIPTRYIKEVSETKIINDPLNKELQIEKKLVSDSILPLEAELEELKKIDAEQQAIIEAQRAQFKQRTAAAVSAVDTAAEKQERDRLALIEKNNAYLENIKKAYTQLEGRILILMKKVNAELGRTEKQPDSPLHKYYLDALKIIRDTPEKHKLYERAAEYLADARSKPKTEKLLDETMEIITTEFNKSKTTLDKVMVLFNEIENIILNKTPEEIETIANLKYQSQRDAPKEAKKDRTKSRLSDEEREAEDKRKQLDTLRALEEQESQFEAILAKSTTKDKFKEWNIKNTKFEEEIEELLRQTKINERKLRELKSNEDDKKFKMLSKKLKEKHIADVANLVEILEKTIPHELDKKRLAYRNFLLENEEFIKTDQHFKEPFKSKLLDKINIYKQSILSTPITPKDKFKEWNIQNTQFEEEIEDLLRQTKINKTKLSELKSYEDSRQFSILSKKSKEEHIAAVANLVEILEKTIPRELAKKHLAYRNFLLENEEFIKTEPQFEEKFKLKLLDKIKIYKESILNNTLPPNDWAKVLFGEASEEEEAALNARANAAYKKYLYYKTKYLLLKKLLQN
jgi:hypothetical protein